MRTIILLLVSFVHFAAPGWSSEDSVPVSTAQQAFLEQYRQAYYNLKFTESSAVLEDQVGQLPEPQQSAMRALLAYSRFALSYDGSQESREELEFQQAAESATEQLQAHLAQHPNDLSAKLNLGVLYGLRGGVALGYEKSYLQAYRFGSRGVDLLNEVYEADPNLHDVQLSSGVLKLMIAQSTWYVRWLAPVILEAGSLPEGLKHLETVLRRGNYVRDEALLAHVLLLWGEVPEDELKTAVQALVQWVRKYPDSLQLYVVLARGYWLLGDPEVANYYALQGIRQLQRHESEFAREHGLVLQSFLLYWHYRYLAEQKEWLKLMRQTQQREELPIQATFQAIALWNMGQYDRAKEVAAKARTALQESQLSMPLFVVPFLFDLTPSLQSLVDTELFQQS